MHSSVEGQALIVAMFQGISDEESPIAEFADSTDAILGRIAFAHILLRRTHELVKRLV
jgi:hypothetical protein